QRNLLDFASIALNHNQRNIGAAVENLGWGNPLYDAVLMLDEDTAIYALDQLSGDIHAGTRSALREESHDLRDAIWTRGGDATGFWMQAIGGWGSIATHGNAARIKTERLGLLTGLDRAVGENGHLGTTIGYSDGKLSSGASSSTVDTRTLHAGVYGGIRAGRYSADAGAGYARHRFDTRRDIAFDTF